MTIPGTGPRWHQAPAPRASASTWLFIAITGAHGSLAIWLVFQHAWVLALLVLVVWLLITILLGVLGIWAVLDEQRRAAAVKPPPTAGGIPVARRTSWPWS